MDPLPHTHVALDDALEQGALFCNMLATLREREAALASLASDAAADASEPSPSSGQP
ncbi:hypothetical protein D3C72_2301670 [compost metagenome]